MENTAICYIKKRGYNVFCMIEYDIRKSHRGYKIASPCHIIETSKYRYYKDMSMPHYVVDDIWGDIHEFGNEKFFEKIGEVI